MEELLKGMQEATRSLRGPSRATRRRKGPLKSCPKILKRGYEDCEGLSGTLKRTMGLLRSYSKVMPGLQGLQGSVRAYIKKYRPELLKGFERGYEDYEGLSGV